VADAELAKDVQLPGIEMVEIKTTLDLKPKLKYVA
jgi:hypothetical protein